MECGFCDMSDQVFSSFFFFVCVCVCVCVYTMCVCVCVCAHKCGHAAMSKHLCTPQLYSRHLSLELDIYTSLWLQMLVLFKITFKLKLKDKS